MPSTTSREVSSPARLFDRDHAVLAHLSIASAMICPIDVSLFAEIVPTCLMALPTTGRDSFLISPERTRPPSRRRA